MSCVNSSEPDGECSYHSNSVVTMATVYHGELCCINSSEPNGELCFIIYCEQNIMLILVNLMVSCVVLITVNKTLC